MAIYHFHAEKGKRWGSAAAKIAYISRTGKYAKCTDQVLHTANGRMPAWAEADPEIFWKAADARERANGRLYREYEFALPRELLPAQQEALAEEYAEHITAEYSLPWSLAIHAGGGTNPHCHLIVNERMNDGLERSADTWFMRYKSADPGAGGAKKTDALEKPKKFLWIREQWAVVANAALEAAGSDARIDHRTLKAQGIDREPTRHIGPSVLGMENRGIRARVGTDPEAARVEPEGLLVPLNSEDQEDEDEPNRDRDRDTAVERRAGDAAAHAQGSRRRAGEAVAIDLDSKRRTRRNKQRAASVRRAKARRADEERASRAADGLGGAADLGDDMERGEAPLDAGDGRGVRVLPPRHVDQNDAVGAGGGGGGDPGRGEASEGNGRRAVAETGRADVPVSSVAPKSDGDGAGVLAPAGAGGRRSDWLNHGGSGMLEPVLVAVVWTRLPGYAVDRELEGRRIWRRSSDADGSVRIVDSGSGLWLGKDGGGADVDAMFRVAAERWPGVRVRVPSRELAQRWLARAAAAGVQVSSVVIAGVKVESREVGAMNDVARSAVAARVAAPRKRARIWVALLPARARRIEVGIGPGGALRPAPADAVRYRGKRLAAGVMALVRREDPDESFARPRIIDAGDRIRAGSGAGELDRRSMLVMAAERWTVLRLSAGSRVAAAELLQRARAVGVIDQVGEISYRDPGGELVTVAGAELARWIESLAGPAPDPQRPGSGPGIEVGIGPGGALRPAPADAVRYRGKRLADGVLALVRREDPDESFATPRLLDAGDRLRVGVGAEEIDRRSMLVMAAQRWTVLRLSAGSRVAAAELLQRARAVGVIDQVGEISYRDPGGELVTVAGAELARWIESLDSPAPRPPDSGPGMGM